MQYAYIKGILHYVHFILFFISPPKITVYNKMRILHLCIHLHNENIHKTLCKHIFKNICTHNIHANVNSKICPMNNVSVKIGVCKGEWFTLGFTRHEILSFTLTLIWTCKFAHNTIIYTRHNYFKMIAFYCPVFLLRIGPVWWHLNSLSTCTCPIFMSMRGEARKPLNTLCGM
jgi:hypothetical protein